MDLIRTYDRAKARLNDLLVSEGLRAKALFGGAWLGGASAAEQVVRFSRNMVLARLLAPSAFGTMAIVLSSSSLVDTLTDVGVKLARTWYRLPKFISLSPQPAAAVSPQ